MDNDTYQTLRAEASMLARRIACAVVDGKPTTADEVRLEALRKMLGDEVEVSRGTGLGEVLPLEEGRRRLAEYAVPEDTMDGESVICPHCDAHHGDAWEWVKGDEATDKCADCGKYFAYWAEYDVTYHARAIEQPAPFEFKVLGLSEAIVEFDRRWPNCIVSLITDTHNLGLLPMQGDHHLHIAVDDLHVENPATPEAVVPTRAMIERVFEHTAKLNRYSRLLVHCFAGQSRSTAMMIGILIQHGVEPMRAFDLVKENRPVLMPNQMIIQHIDDYFELGGALVQRNWAFIREELQITRSTQTERPTGGQVSAMKSIMDLFRDE